MRNTEALSEEETRRIEDLLGIWKYVVDIRAHRDFYAGKEPQDELDAAIANIDRDIESVFKQLNVYEESEMKSLPAKVVKKRRKRERKFLREAVLRKIERIRRDLDRGQHEVLDSGAAQALYVTHADPLDVGEEVGEKCHICGATWPTTGLKAMCTCTKALAHQQCLVERLRFRCETKCELCGRQYDLDWRPHHGVLHGLQAWILQDASKVELLLVLFLAALVMVKTILLGGFILSSKRSVLDARAGDNSTVPKGTRGCVWCVAKESWHHMVARTDMPGWVLPLAICVLLMHTGLAVILSVTNIRSFRLWYCREASVDFREEQQQAAGHSPAA